MAIRSWLAPLRAVENTKNYYRFSILVDTIDDDIGQTTQDPFTGSIDFPTRPIRGKNGILFSIASRICSATDRALVGLSFAIQPTIFSRSSQAVSRIITFKELSSADVNAVLPASRPWRRDRVSVVRLPPLAQKKVLARLRPPHNRESPQQPIPARAARVSAERPKHLRSYSWTHHNRNIRKFTAPAAP